jgi:hypothetical protein
MAVLAVLAVLADWLIGTFRSIDVVQFDCELGSPINHADDVMMIYEELFHL